MTQHPDRDVEQPRQPLLSRGFVCPVHRQPLALSDDRLCCAQGCRYPVISGIPLLLPRDVPHTHSGIAARSFALADEMLSAAPAARDERSAAEIDPFVQQLVAGTNSNLYVGVIGRLTDYPIPNFPMKPAHAGDLLLDIGCGWGRWSIAASRAGFRAVGVDPSLESALAAQRLAQRLGAAAEFVVADSRFLPFPPATFDAAYSYSVLQHFSKSDVHATLVSLATVMKPGGVTKLHLLNRLGLRSLQVQLSRGFRPARDFETRYWSLREMTAEFSAELGPSRIEIDGFFVQGRYEDRHLFKPSHRAILEISRWLTQAARAVPLLLSVADNVFVVSTIRSATEPRP